MRSPKGQVQAGFGKHRACFGRSRPSCVESGPCFLKIGMVRAQFRHNPGESHQYRLEVLPILTRNRLDKHHPTLADPMLAKFGLLGKWGDFALGLMFVVFRPRLDNRRGTCPDTRRGGTTSCSSTIFVKVFQSPKCQPTRQHETHNTSHLRLIVAQLSLRSYGGISE